MEMGMRGQGDVGMGAMGIEGRGDSRAWDKAMVGRGMWVREVGTLVSREACRCPGGDVVMRPQRFSMEGISSILHSGLRQTFGPATNEKQVLPFSPQIAQICPLSPALLHSLFPCISQTHFPLLKYYSILQFCNTLFPSLQIHLAKSSFFIHKILPSCLGSFCSIQIIQYPPNVCKLNVIAGKLQTYFAFVLSC